MQERLQKILSRAGIASRRGAEEVMLHGRVTVNGETIRELGTKADIQTRRRPRRRRADPAAEGARLSAS